jgi:hypothetical protein
MRFAGKIFALLVAIVLVCATASWAAQGGQGATAPGKTKEVGSKKAEGKAVGKDTAPGLPKAEAKREASATKKEAKEVKKDAKAEAKETKKDMKAEAKETKKEMKAEAKETKKETKPAAKKGGGKKP